MRRISSWLIAPPALLLIVGEVSAQAGRLPLPRIPAGGGGSVSRPFAPHIPGFGMDGQDIIWMLIAAIVVAIVMGYAGVALGRAAGRFCFDPRTEECNQTPVSAITAASETTASAPGTESTLGSESVPEMDPLILSESEVAEKAHETEELMRQVACRDPFFEPRSLREALERVFHLVQQCWQERDYSRLYGLLAPDILAKHEAMLSVMRQWGEINRVEDLQIRRFEFVQVHSTGDPERMELTALITFLARVYFVNESTNVFLHGSHQVGLYQEFWTFSRQESAWQLETIERSHKSDRLKAANHVEEVSPG
jgi:predicted lipid-binding transport protein (Tim44 family)